MDARRTFVITLLINPAEPQTLRGRAHHVASGSACTFIGAEQLLAFLQAPMPTRPAVTHAPPKDENP